MNRGLTNIVETWHDGQLLDTPYAGIIIERPNVMQSAIKRSEDGFSEWKEVLLTEYSCEA